MTLENVLRNSSLFHNLSDLDIQHLVPISKHVEVEQGTDILREGEPVSHIHIVEEGRVALQMTLERPDGSSTGPTTVATVGPGRGLRLVWPGGALSEHAHGDCR